MFKKIAVVFAEYGNWGNKQYTYYAPNDMKVKVEDLVIVPAYDIFSVGRVVHTGEIESELKEGIKVIHSVINMTEWEKNTEKKDKIVKLMKELDSAYRNAKRIAIYKQLADSNPQIKELMDSLADIAPEYNLLEEKNGEAE